MLEAAAVILAGGKSTRMGQNKALLKIREHRMLEDAVTKLSGVFAEILISANDELYNNLNKRVVPDVYKDFGPLGGIHATLKQSGHHVNFFTACDMPFIDVKLAVYMINLIEGYDAVVPRIGEYYQPLFAVYTKDCLQAVESLIDAGRRKTSAIYDLVRVKFIDTHELCKFGNPDEMFFNVNTPLDIELAKNMARRKQDGPTD